MSDRAHWTWQDWALLGIVKLAVWGVPVVLAAIMWAAWVRW